MTSVPPGRCKNPPIFGTGHQAQSFTNGSDRISEVLSTSFLVASDGFHTGTGPQDLPNNTTTNGTESGYGTLPHPVLAAPSVFYNGYAGNRTS